MNCFVGVDGIVKVGDFGLSVSTELDAQSQLTRDGGFAGGTSQYASPEQLRGEELDLRSDIDSFGATLQDLLTSKPPFLTEQVVQARHWR